MHMRFPYIMGALAVLVRLQLGLAWLLLEQVRAPLTSDKDRDSMLVS